MELATVTSRGQITIPAKIRRRLDLKTGNKIIFFDDGENIVIKKSSTESALEAIQGVLAPLASEHGIITDGDVNALVEEYRNRNRITVAEMIEAENITSDPAAIRSSDVEVALRELKA